MLPSCGNKRHYHPAVPSEPSQKSTHAVLRTVICSYNMCFLGVDVGTWGGGGGGKKKKKKKKKKQKPATQICHRLRNKAQLSQRGMHPGDSRVRPQRAAAARVPFSTLLPLYVGGLSALLPLLLPRPPVPLPAPLPSLARKPSRPPAPSQGSARSALVPPPVLPQPLRPSSGKTNPGAAWKGRSRRRRGPAGPARGPCPCPPPTPQQVAPKRAARSHSTAHDL
ncbi:translation initiation factor IF-2-like [Pipistrellus kuhlii]|uniref:translation initiation factor IF-2-like n=1 Tax=Pipistrellus kuhlii TaxID=59472 RepID=UPI001E270464|nr:translation initiation factor IF-2-like [Pipistrellus kuhlii]